MTGPVFEHDIPKDFTPQISERLKLARPCASGAFGDVYRITIETSECTMEVAVKVFKIDPERAIEKTKKSMHRELMVWLKLRHSTIVPLLGTANVESPFPALVSQWMCSGTLYRYIKQAAATVSAKDQLIAGIADGLKYLHSENVIHGDLHPANVLVDDSGHPRLTDFGLATVVGDAELQLSTTTATRSLDPRWRAPEVVGIERAPERPTFESDIYSFGGIIFFVISEDIPWKEKNSAQVCIEMSKRANPVRPDNIPDNRWDVIHKCWAWDPASRPKAAEVIFFTRTNATIVAPARDLTGQIFRTINDYVANGAFGNVYGETGVPEDTQQCGWVDEVTHRRCIVFGPPGLIWMLSHLNTVHDVCGSDTAFKCRWAVLRSGHEFTCGTTMQRRNAPRHIAMHLGVYWICNLCGQRFSRSDAVRYHEREVHQENVTRYRVLQSVYRALCSTIEPADVHWQAPDTSE